MVLPVHIALLELKRYLVNRGELAFSIALPIALFALMYGALGGGESSFHATLDLVDLDGGAHARALVDRLDSVDGIEVRERSLADADAALERSAILNAAVIPAGFSAALDAGAEGSVALWDAAVSPPSQPSPVKGGRAISPPSQPSPIEGEGALNPAVIIIKQRGNGGLDGQVLAAATQAAARELAGELQFRYAAHKALEGSGIAAGRIDIAVNERLAEERANPSVGVVTRAIGGDEDGDEAGRLARLVPGILVMFLMFALTMGAQTLVEERHNMTLERLLTTRISVNGLFVGKFLAGTLRATLQAAVLLGLAFLALRIGGAADFGRLMAFSVLVAATVSAMGLVIGAAARSRDQAMWSAVAVTMFMTVFGGTFFDVSANAGLDALSRITLTRYAVDAMFEMLAGGQSLFDQWLGAAVMAGGAVVFLVAARALFRVAGGGR